MVMYCKRCLFPDTKPDLYFDADGICDACHSSDRIQGALDAINWNVRKNEFEQLVDKYRALSGYDCIVPVSGGKDSTWQVYAMKNVYGMKPLAVTFDQFDQTDTGTWNLNILKSIGVDHIHFSLNPLVVKKLVRKGFEVVGDPYWVNHVGMFTIPFTIAANFGVKLVVYGENPQLEYGGPKESRDAKVMDRRWRQEFSGMRGFREDDMVDDTISSADIDALRYPPEDLIAQTGVKGVFFGHFHKWDAHEHLKVCKSLGWKELPTAPDGSWAPFENCDMRFIDLREHIKYLKFGYGRASDQLNIEIRNRRISRSEALDIANQIDGVCSEQAKQEFADYIEISVNDVKRIIDSFVNTEIFELRNGAWKLKNARI